MLNWMELPYQPIQFVDKSDDIVAIEIIAPIVFLWAHMCQVSLPKCILKIQCPLLHSSINVEWLFKSHVDKIELNLISHLSFGKSCYFSDGATNISEKIHFVHPISIFWKKFWINHVMKYHNLVVTHIGAHVETVRYFWFYS